MSYASAINELIRTEGPHWTCCIVLPHKYINHLDDVEDLMGDCVEACLRAKKKHDPNIGTIDTLFWTTARNRCFKYLEKLVKYKRSDEVSSEIFDESVEPDGPSKVEADEFWTDYLEARDSILTDKQKQAWELKNHANYTYRSISAVMRRSKKTVESSVRRSKKKLAYALRHHAPADSPEVGVMRPDRWNRSHNKVGKHAN